MSYSANILDSLHCNWKTVVLKIANRVPHQRIYTVRGRRLSPKLRLEIRVIIVNQLSSKQTESRYGIAVCARGGFLTHADGLKAPGAKI